MEKEKIRLAQPGATGRKYVPRELYCAPYAWKVIGEHPFIFAKEWLREVNKTTFDLYSSQLVAFAKGTYTYDELEEFLSEKIQECLYKTPMHWSMRIICWLEFLFSILIWIGLFAGLWLFMLYPLYKRFAITSERAQISALWLKTTPFIGGILIMTGAFGYARLRLPVEGLMIILALTTWHWWCTHNKKA